MCFFLLSLIRGAALEIVQHFGAAPFVYMGWTMFFHFDFYPADLMAVIAGRTAAEAGEIVQKWLIGLISNSVDCITDSKARESASKMLERCRQRSDLYRVNGSKRKAATKSEKPEPKETPDQTKKAAQKPPKAPLFGFALVNVTDKERTDLERRFGAKLEKMAYILQNYKEQSGKKYKSDAAAIRGWVADKVAEQERRNGSKGFKEQERQRDAQNAVEMLTDEQKHFYGLD